LAFHLNKQDLCGLAVLLGYKDIETNLARCRPTYGGIS